MTPNSRRVNIHSIRGGRLDEGREEVGAVCGQPLVIADERAARAGDVPGRRPTYEPATTALPFANGYQPSAKRRTD
ncbi:MAG TPA: hypothetical protein VGQ39_19100 [Pyrinomonadaceae bacterium]|nr:hypothetical protein [Pyrinomonadaceae bacterium]